MTTSVSSQMAPQPPTLVATICRMCHGGCGALVEVMNGEPVSIQGDPSNPTSEGFFCIKGKASLDLLRSEDRLRTPLVRIGPRGSGRFEPIDWETALDQIAASLADAARTLGPESIVLCQGTDRNYQEWVFRLANAIGTPNVSGPAHVCFYPRVMASILTFGGFTFCDYDGDPEVVLLWGSNKTSTHSDGVIGVKLIKAMERGSQVIAIDPKRQMTCLGIRRQHDLGRLARARQAGGDRAVEAHMRKREPARQRLLAPQRRQRHGVGMSALAHLAPKIIDMAVAHQIDAPPAGSSRKSCHR